MTANPDPGDAGFLDRPVAAVTGGTGFLGRFIVRALDAAGYRVRLLVRGDPTHPLFADLRLELVPGDLGDARALARLVDGAAVVVHGAGLIKAARRAQFMAVNRDGSRRVAEAVASHAPGTSLLLISSLAAREPQLSAYAASKRAGEEAARAELGDQRLLIVRPPAIYGPWDRETLAVFKAAAGPIAPLLGGPDARIALIHVEDCAAAIAALARAGTVGAVLELADDNPAGYGWDDLAAAAAAALGTRPRRLRIPAAALRVAGVLGSFGAAVTGRAVMITTGKVREVLHDDWSVRAERLPPATLWRAQRDLKAGFQSVADWYRQAGWLDC